MNEQLRRSERLATEQDRHSAFEELVGGPTRAFRCLHIYQDSYPSGTAWDRLGGKGMSKEEVFRRKAKREGFNDTEIHAFLELQ